MSQLGHCPRGLIVTTGGGIMPRPIRRRDEPEMNANVDEMGPIDYLLVEWPAAQPNGEVAPPLIGLVERGLIRILDLAFLRRGEDGGLEFLEIADVGGEVSELAVFEGAS